MYVVAGVTGQTGRGVAQTLLAQGEKVRVTAVDGLTLKVSRAGDKP